MNIKNHSLSIKNHIQSIRAFSVIIVFFYHTNLDIFSLGYMGVDIFFFKSFDFLCENNKCPIYLKQSDTLFYRDQSHLTYEGARTILENFNKLLIDKELIENEFLFIKLI